MQKKCRVNESTCEEN